MTASCEKYDRLDNSKTIYITHEKLIHDHFSRGWAYIQGESTHQFITPDGRWKDIYTKEGKWLRREPLYKAA